MISVCFRCPNPALVTLRAFADATDVIFDRVDNEWDLCADCLGPATSGLARTGQLATVTPVPLPVEPVEA